MEVPMEPKADFSGVPDKGVVKFKNNSTGADSYTWDFGDESGISRDAEPVHTYTKQGTFKVKLLASGAGGNHAITKSFEINLSVAAAEPVPGFTFVGDNCTAPCDVTFTNTSTNADTYAWDFKNGMTSNLKDPGKITFGKSGSYEVSMKATGPGGNGTAKQIVTIKEAVATTLQKDWDKVYGGAEDDVLIKVLSLDDGSIILAGTSKSQPTYGGEDFRVIKINSSGDKVWEGHYGGSDNDGLRSICKVDGGFVLVGYTFSGKGGNKESDLRKLTDFWIVKIDDSGNHQWDRTFGGSNFDEASSVVAVSGGVLVGGYSKSTDMDRTAVVYGDNDMWLIKLDNSGNETWQKSYGGAQDDRINCMVATSDGGAYLAGYSGSPQSDSKRGEYYGYYDFWVVKIDSRGTKQWDRSFGGEQEEQVYAVLETSDGGVLLGGSAKSAVSGNKTSPKISEGTDSWVVKLKNNGDKDWESAFGSSKNNYLSGMAAADGGYLLVGSTDSDRVSGDTDGWFAKINEAGIKQYDINYGGNQLDYLRTITKTNDGYIIGATSFSGASGNKTAQNIGNDDFWVLKLK